jgi:hypothetical protein
MRFNKSKSILKFIYMKSIQIKVKQPAQEVMVEFTLPAYRKRSSWYYAVVSEKEAIQVFKSEYGSVGTYFCTGERMVSDAFDVGTEPCTKEEFLEALNWSIANMMEITRQVKEDKQ